MRCLLGQTPSHLLHGSHVNVLDFCLWGKPFSSRMCMLCYPKNRSAESFWLSSSRPRFSEPCDTVSLSTNLCNQSLKGSFFIVGMQKPKPLYDLGIAVSGELRISRICLKDSIVVKSDNLSGWISLKWGFQTYLWFKKVYESSLIFCNPIRTKLVSFQFVNAESSSEAGRRRVFLLCARENFEIPDSCAIQINLEVLSTHHFG